MLPQFAQSSLESVYARALQPYEGRFEAEALMREAEEATGLSDWGGERWAEQGFRARFTALCDGIEGEAQITTAGRSGGHSRLHMMLCSRLRIVAWSSGMADQAPIVAPLIGTGMPRAGTSFLHQLLAQDPDNICATAAQAAIPIPPPGAIADEAERVRLMERLFAFQGLDRADINALHPFVADQPEECVNLQEAGCASLYQAFFNVPSYMTVVRKTVADLFAWQVGVMQVLQAGRAGKRWVLKTPEHMSNWATMRATFPDAKIFMNYRDPAKVVPSIASLFVTFQRLYSEGAVDPKYLGPPMLAGEMEAMEKVGAWRAAHPEVTVVDVHYLDLIADPIGTAERVYAAFGLVLGAKVKQRMADFIKVNCHGQAVQGVRHRYDLADFGLTEAMIEDVCGSYLDKYGVVRERRK